MFLAFVKNFKYVFCFLQFGAVIAKADRTRIDESKLSLSTGSIPGEELRKNNLSAIAFSAARTEPLKGHKQIQYSLSFDHVYLNKGEYFDPDSGMFTAPIHGIYGFTFSGGALPHKRLSLQLMKNHFEIQTLAFDGHRKKNPNVQKQNILLELNRGERVWIKLPRSRQYGIVGASGRGYVTTFSGRLLPGGSKKDLPSDPETIRLAEDNTFIGRPFLRSKRQTTDQYLTNRGQSFIAFSVAKTTSIIGRSRNSTVRNPHRNGIITFDKDFVNIGSAINLLSGEFKAPIDGLYYFSFTVGKYPRMKLSVSLVKNDSEFQVMVYDESRSNKRQMQSQSVILCLKSGDKMWLKHYNVPGYAVYSNLGNYITFSGYILNTL